tara:strand:+ start:34 stop:903 length:870 start_codon:yes stop_codon:yes gene_type:complete
MKITNVLNLPQPIVDAVQNDPYDSGESDISVTRLISPPRQVALANEHGRKLTEDCADRLFSLMGQAMHHILERGGDVEGTRIIEKRLFADVGGWKISGQIDIWENGVLDDYKFTSVWETLNGLKEEKIQQLNMLAWLSRLNGIKVDKIRIVALYRDWSKSKAEFERDYPQHQIGVIEVPMWDDFKTAAFIDERVAIHQAARLELPFCTDEERWQRATKYAVMKEGRKSAFRLLDSSDAAMIYCEDKGFANDGELKTGYYVEIRRGEATRCKHYCAVAPFCTQFNPIQES